MSGSIFISYRRSDAGGHAGRLHDRLVQWFDTDALFFDTEHIQPGDDFPQRLVDGIDSAKVVLVLVGPRAATLGRAERAENHSCAAGHWHAAGSGRAAHIAALRHCAAAVT